MAWLAVNRYNREYIYEEKPKRCYCCIWAQTSLLSSVIELPKGSIKKLIGRELSWEDEPVELPNLTRRNNMAKYKVGDIFINHNDGKILQVCEGYCEEECCYYDCCYKTFPFSKDITCTSLVGMPNHIKELPFLPPGTKVKMRKNLKVGTEYEKYTFVEKMKQNKEVTIERYFASHKAYSVAENACNYTLKMFDQVINEPKESNNMETKEIKIKVPEGYEIDRENSTYECIKFKPVKKELTYEDVVEELFSNSYYYISGCCKIVTGPPESKGDKNNATNKKQLEKLLALNQLLNIAEYYNKKSPKEGNKVYCVNFDERNKTTEYFVGEYTRPMIVRGLVPMFNRHEDVSAVIYNPNFKAILDLVYKDDED